MNILEECKICPHECKVNRLNGNIGRCRSTDKIKIALVSLHQYEEPCISGKNGSGTIFFSNCNLSCMYCQNYEISQEGKGFEISIEELAKIMLEQQNKGAHNINLVTP
ncbi:MAG TPA: radical SAM protein, partial [Clostridiales bacterium]|nr:radical SAM protein [Clostridiales bacterium]